MTAHKCKACRQTLHYLPIIIASSHVKQHSIRGYHIKRTYRHCRIPWHSVKLQVRSKKHRATRKLCETHGHKYCVSDTATTRPPAGHGVVHRLNPSDRRHSSHSIWALFPDHTLFGEADIARVGAVRKIMTCMVHKTLSNAYPYVAEDVLKNA